MRINTILLSNGILGSAYKFSDHIVCIEVTKNGQQLGSFCTDTAQFDEWEEEEIKTLIEQHVELMETASLKQMKQKQFILNRYELQYYTHSESLFCVNVLDGNKVITSFCTDKETFDEWMEDEEQLTNVVKVLLENDKK